MDFQLQEKVALVTGGSRGIGRAIALTLASQGMHVAICGRTRETLDNTATDIEKHDVKAWAFQTDVSQLEELEQLVNKTLRAAGRIDVLVNNAVTSTSAPFNELTDDLFRYHIDVKLMAYIRLARLVLTPMRAAGWGRVINIGGMTARIVAPLRITNGVVNAGIANFSKQFSSYAAQHQVTVNCIHPGYTVTERVMELFSREAEESSTPIETIIAKRTKEIPLGKLVQPDDIAAAVLFFCSPMANMITGQSIAVDGGSGEAVMY